MDVSKGSRKPEKLAEELVSAIEATPLNMTTGPCISIKVGVASQNITALAENIDAVLVQFFKRVSGGSKNIRSVYLKTSSSTALPVFIRNEHQ